MLARFKNTPGVAWLVIGACVTALVLPSAAYATGVLKQVGIEGTSTNRADVSAAGQLKTAPASPSSFFQGQTLVIPASACPEPCTTAMAPIAVPASSSALVVTVVHVDFANVDVTDAAVEVQNNPTCTGSQVGSYAQTFTDAGYYLGERDSSLDPGLVVPAGDALCADATIAGGSGFVAYISASGYSIPAAAA